MCHYPLSLFSISNKPTRNNGFTFTSNRKIIRVQSFLVALFYNSVLLPPSLKDRRLRLARKSSIKYIFKDINIYDM
jgi:hypothetical protein